MVFLSNALLWIAGIIFIAGIISVIAEEKKWKDRPADWHFKRKEMISGFSVLTVVCLIGSCWAAPKYKQDVVGVNIDTVNAHADKNLTKAQELTLVDRRKLLPVDDDYVIQVQNQLELLSNKYHEPIDTIAEWTNRGQSLLHEKGIEDYNLSIMKEVNKSSKIDNSKYSDIVTLYVMLRVGKDK